MRILKVFTLVAASTVMLTGLASAQSMGNGTPDAKGGAIGRNQPSSLNGHAVRHSAGLLGHRMHHRHYYRRHHHHM